MYGRKVMLRLFWTIIVIFSLCIMTLMLGCSGRQKQKEVGVYNVDTLSHINYSIYIIDSCEYIIFYGGSSTWGSHKGNCNNPKHVH
jgi:uncharacterized membrane protein